jgi:small nuclear ribonucleoprotein (snRNP)-like protein/biotin carboxyl carrier protein
MKTRAMRVLTAIWITLICVAACAALVARAQAQADARDLAGEWSGVLGGRLHLVVTISTSSTGELGGTLNSVDQHAVLTLANVKLDGAKAHFEVPRVGGVYDGTMNAKGDLIDGKWTQTGVPPQDLDMKRTSGAPAASASAATQNAPATTSATKDHTPKPLTVGLDTLVHAQPVAFKSGGKWHVAYELHVVNMDKWDYALQEIDIVPADAPDSPVAKFAGSALADAITYPGIGAKGAAGPATLRPGEDGVVYLWLTADSLDAIPATLRNKIKVRVGDYPEALTVNGPSVSVDKKTVVVIASPLDRSNLVAANGPSNTSAHRRALIPVDGHAYISQRYAIDWVEAYPDGKTYQGDEKDNKNYKIYGAEIHSVADGVVTETKDGIPQNIPNADTHAVPITLETIGGNHVIVDIGGGRYAFYAHMQPGSLRVKVGDHVKSGDVLGLVGNTGNSSEPHLHFDICDASSMLACEGLPYAFASFDVTGSAAGDGSSLKAAAAVTRTMEIPAEDEVVTLRLK